MQERRYDASRGMSLLIEDWVSKASAQQRKGRAGSLLPCTSTTHLLWSGLLHAVNGMNLSSSRHCICSLTPKRNWVAAGSLPLSAILAFQCLFGVPHSADTPAEQIPVATTPDTRAHLFSNRL